MLRRTKIIATLGPATDDPAVLDQLILAGVDLVRLNLSHDSADIHLHRARVLRERAQALGRQVGVLVDLRGPKIRIGKFRDSRVQLQNGHRFVLDMELALDAGTAEGVGVTYKQLAQDVTAGDTLLLDDGRIALFGGSPTDPKVRARIGFLLGGLALVYGFLYLDNCRRFNGPRRGTFIKCRGTRTSPGSRYDPRFRRLHSAIISSAYQYSNRRCSF